MMTRVELRDDVLEVPIATAARVAEVSRRRLAAWAELQLIKPTSLAQRGHRRVWGYGFDELVLARIVRELELRGVNIRQIDRIVRAAREAIAGGDLGRLKWATSEREAFVELPDGSWLGGRQPNQTRLVGVLNLAEIRSETRRRVARPSDLAGRTERRRGTHGSRAVFAGTRVPVDTVVRYVKAGRSVESILESFPVLEPGDVALAMDLAAA